MEKGNRFKAKDYTVGYFTDEIKDCDNSNAILKQDSAEKWNRCTNNTHTNWTRSLHKLQSTYLKDIKYANIFFDNSSYKSSLSFFIKLNEKD